MRTAQIIALLLPEPRAARRDEFAIDTATALLRDTEGRMSLQPLTREQMTDMSKLPFAEQVMTTGCFRRGKPIIDPVTREVMGYEMEAIEAAELRIAEARLQLSC